MLSPTRPEPEQNATMTRISNPIFFKHVQIEFIVVSVSSDFDIRGDLNVMSLAEMQLLHPWRNAFRIM